MHRFVSRAEDVDLLPLVPRDALQRVEASLGELARSIVDHWYHLRIGDRDDIRPDTNKFSILPV